MKTEQEIYNQLVAEKVKAKFTTGGNIKLGSSMGVWSTLKGDDEIYIPKLECNVKGTCGKHCINCTGSCYVNKSYVRYPSVPYGHAIRTILLRFNRDQVLEDLDNQIKRKRIKFTTIRINQSGELENKEQLQMWSELAKRHPEVTFYLYTKNYEAVKQVVKTTPTNLVMLLSIWHDQGIKEFKELKDYTNIKAFVYDDLSYDYAKDKLLIQSYCAAYDKKGKMNHSVTCDVCKKCFNDLDSCKIIGCYDH